jgi:hypothetical protein
MPFMLGQNKFSYGTEFKGGYSDNVFTTQAQFQGQETKSSFEKPMFSFSVGLIGEFSPCSLISFQTGLRWIETGYTTDRYAQSFYGVSLRTPAAGQPYVIDDFKSSYLELPLNVKFYLVKKAYFLTGASATVRLSDRIVSNNYIDGKLTSRFVNISGQNGLAASSKGFWQDQFDYRDVNATIQLGFGYDLTIFQKTAVSIQPTAQYFLLTTTPRKTDYYNRRLFNFGLAIATKI